MRLRARDTAFSVVFFLIYSMRKAHYDVRARGRRKVFPRPDVLFSNDCAYWREYLHRNGTLSRDDVILGEVIAFAEQQGLRVACLDVGILRRSFKAQADRFDPGSPWFCLEQFVTYEILGRSFATALRWILVGRSRGEDALGAFHQIESSFREAFACRMADRLLDEMAPRSVFTGAECLFMHRALARAARVRGLPAFALQHGDIHPNAAYFFPNDQKAIMARTIPTHTFVYSPTDRKKLVEDSIYVPDAVFVTGNPRWDVLGSGRNVYGRAEIANRYGIPATRYVLWTTKSHRLTRAEAAGLRLCIGRCAKRLKDVAIVVKEHPNAGRRYERLMRRALATFGNVAVVPSDADTDALLCFCDLLVSYQSTTVSEAIACGKPAILFERPELLSQSKFVLLRVAAGVSEEKELVPTIERLLSDDSELAVNRADYVDRYLFAIDGRATERVVGHVVRVLQERDGNSRSVVSNELNSVGETVEV